MSCEGDNWLKISKQFACAEPKFEDGYLGHQSQNAKSATYIENYVSELSFFFSSYHDCDITTRITEQ